MLDVRLYLVTDRSFLAGRDFLAVIGAALRGGVTMLQLREKDISSRDYYELAVRVRDLAREQKVPMWINDRLDVALAANADGLHVGQDDMPAVVARQMMPAKMKLGVTVHNVEQALQAEKDGADCLGVGTLFPTGTKKDSTVINPDIFRQIKAAVKIPVVAIGGIQAHNVEYPLQLGADGIAVVSAIMAADNPEKAARELREKIDAAWQK
jgi:thiamine-phosphate pyrophosphorylase